MHNDNSPSPQPKKGATSKLLWMLLAIIAVYLFASTRSTLWDRDEPRFARATYEMVETGNYLYPTFNGELRPDKPIMIYWLMSVPVRTFEFLGPHALPARFVAAFGTAFSCLFTFLIARRLFDQRTALWSAGILASTLLIFMIGTAATADSILLPAMVGTLWLFYRALDRGKLSILGTLGMACFLGFALLAKGPVGLLPLLVMLVVLWLRKLHEINAGPALSAIMLEPHCERNRFLFFFAKLMHTLATTVLLIAQRRDNRTRFWPIFAPALVAVLLAFGIFIAWAIPANNATHGEFLRLGIGKHVIDRSASPMESHGGNFFLYLPYYFIIPIFTFYPWSLHMPAAVNASIGGRSGGTISRELVLGWALPVVVLMTFVATKLPHYMILSFPALAIVTAAFITGYRNELSRWDGKLLRGGIWFFGAVNTGLAIAMIAVPIYLQTGMLGYIGGAVTAAIMLTGGFFVNKHQLKEDTTRSTPIMIKTFAAAMVVILLTVLPAIDGTKMPYRVAKIITSETSKDTTVGYCDFREPSLNFYIGRHIEDVGHGQVAKWFADKQHAVLIIPQDLYEQADPKPADVSILGQVTGMNYSNGKRETILAVEKGG